MRLRQNIVAIFSTFLQFEADQFSHWSRDPQLHRSMKKCLAEQSLKERSERFWGLYWYKIWETSSQSQQKAHTRQARSHLTAYLQEAGYWAAKKATTDFRQLNYEVSDCFQIALSSVDRILQGFDPLQTGNFKSYASIVLSNHIREILRQRQEIDICSPWALLRKLSQKRLVESLQQAGLSTETINAYVLVWKCFKSNYVPSGGSPPTRTRQLPKPDNATLEAIANQYNQDRYSQLNVPGSTLNPQTIEQYLLDCVKAARAYLYPTVSSINQPTPGQESGELVDILPESESESLLGDLITQEEEQQRLSQQAQMNQTLTAILTQITPDLQQILDLYYGQGLTQKEIAQQLETKQYTVSRRLTKAKQTLLLKLSQWSQQTLHISLTSDILNSMSTVLEEWLTNHYQ
ncbi:putative group 3/4 sigma-70 RNA polymerase sigma factor [Crocosphaera subtropica ATCC 51142]|uniref:Group 3/4 sigma-70 RNA polymerase sigma factor n=1 Tax=Crocosphaera subtropica (strain ATCC 51142 / BH68) TaxID=43989 RepID=B1X1H7_CROS5|nr:sigma-70 family RNA polymerase sigma factor [Crocosphaera subtropica]ACB51406.1 putative group 3/4 sigma-70 RNA polymerase sigma factor [Crocosphaera subtropica ATCC 51142]